MKTLLRLALGTIAGIVLGLLLPLSGGDTLEVFSHLFRITINIGRYALFPLVFFSCTLGVFELHSDTKLPRVGLVLFTLIPLCSLAASGFGVLAAALFRPERIPIIVKTGEILSLPDVLGLFERIFPSNLFSVFTADPSYLLPIVAASVLIGLTFHHHHAHALPGLELFDSLSRVFFRASYYVVEFMTIGFVVLAGYRILQIRDSADLDLFLQLFLLVGGTAVFIGFIVYPLVLFIVGGRRNPLPWLKGMLMPVLAGLLSGDAYFSVPYLVHHGKAFHRLPRKIGSTVYPLSALFARSGTAMVVAVSFLVILQSYSSLELTASTYLWVFVSSFGVSFLLGGVPGSGVLIGLALISSWYAQGMEEGYLILLPAAPFLIAIGVFLDTLTAGFVAALTAHSAGMEMKPAQ